MFCGKKDECECIWYGSRDERRSKGSARKVAGPCLREVILYCNCQVYFVIDWIFMYVERDGICICVLLEIRMCISAITRRIDLNTCKSSSIVHSTQPTALTLV